MNGSGVIARRAASGFLCAALCAVAVESRAEEERYDPALAHDLFDQGRELMAQKDWVHAAGKFEQSRRADPSGGGGTVLNLALCEEMMGKTGTAWALFRTALGLAIRDRRTDREEFARAHVEALTPRLVRLSITVPGSARVPGLEVKRNGVSLAESEWGASLVVDPGEQSVDVSAPRRAPAHLLVRLVTEGTAEEVVVSPLVPLSPVPQRRSRVGEDQRTAGILVGAAGIAAIASGTIFGIRAVRRNHQADSLCPDYEHCAPQGITLSADAARDGRVATGLVVGGLVTVAVGVVAYWLAPRGAPPPIQTSAGAPAIAF